MLDPILHFQLDQPVNEATLTYRPYSTRTLKLLISSNNSDQPPLRLRPVRMIDSDKQSGTFRGWPADSDAFVLSWGGGHEPGPCVKAKDRFKVLEEPVALAAGEQSYLYFNLTHIRPDELPKTAVLTLEAYQPAKLGTPEKVISTLNIRLQRPDPLPPAVRRFVPVAGDDNHWQVSEGTHLPAYDPRWWPEQVYYLPAAAKLPLSIVCEQNQLEVLWDGRLEPIAVITDKTDPSLLQDGTHRREHANTVLFDLFQFDAHHIALRVWFFWLNKKIGGKLFIGRHEVPDAERFDFIIRQESGAVIFVCTDLHWSEVWGEVETMPLQVSLGLSREMIYKEVSTTVARWLGWQKEGDHDESADAYNPIDFIRSRTIARYEKETLNQVRDKGSEAHVPQLHDVIEYHPNPFTGRNQMVSNDVRLVFD
jgi:hypothetical protein